MILFSTLLSVLLMILVPVSLAAGLKRRAPTPWILFSLGSLTFILSQVIHLPLNAWLVRLGLLSGPGGPTLAAWREALVLGLTAGISEELLRAGGYAYLRRYRPDWLRFRDAVMLGLGHGGIEAMIFGGVLTAASVSALLALRGADLESLGLLPDQVAALQLQLGLLVNAPYAPFVALLERMLALAAHVTFSVIVWRAFSRAWSRRSLLWLLAAIGYHAALDGGVVYAARTWPELGYGIEAVAALIVLPGVVWLVRLSRREQDEALAPDRSGFGSDWRVFRVALQKEIRQLWRTKRFLVVAAVFLLFGMGSPLLAKLTPELLRSIEGAEAFADLIPEPTAGDAIAQYLKNITQFGFLIAVLIGMGAVVGERERGVAPMILSKPMPRWVFVTSKFSAQAVMYLGAFVLAAVGGYFYTVVLFGPIDVGKFALVNGLLFLWLATFVSIALLGSTLAGSTAAAGGVGLFLSILILVSGSLPGIGEYFPGGLIGWANRLGLTAAGTASSALNPPDVAPGSGGGAAAGALVLIVMVLIISIGVFEQQEI